MEAALGSFPVDTKAQNFEINKFPTDCVVSKFSDKLFVLITQFGKVGNLVEVRRDVAQRDDPNTSVFNIRVLLGRDEEEIVVAARFLMNYIPTDKTVLIALSLKDYLPQTLRQVGEHIKSHPSFTKSD